LADFRLLKHPLVLRQSPTDDAVADARRHAAAAVAYDAAGGLGAGVAFDCLVVALAQPLPRCVYARVVLPQVLQAAVTAGRTVALGSLGVTAAAAAFRSDWERDGR
jgi:threonine dehydrogenase-like Zn-dependent dehydrogenase